MNIYEMICIFLCGRLWAYWEYKIYLSVHMRKSHIFDSVYYFKNGNGRIKIELWEKS